MELWTIQTEEAWNSLDQHGHLQCPRSDADGDFLPAYDWMAAQMRARIGSPQTSKISVPIWAWRQYDGIKRRRPDLRASGHLPSGVRGYRVAFTVPDKIVLLSDFELWHHVLNYWYIPYTKADHHAFDEQHPKFLGSWTEPIKNKPVDRKVRESWKRIFDLQWRDPYICHPQSKKSIQATLWQINRSWVTAADQFVAR